MFLVRLLISNTLKKKRMGGDTKFFTAEVGGATNNLLCQ